MRVARIILVLLLASLLIPATQGAINKPRDFRDQPPYMAGINANDMTVVSGDVDATVVSAGSAYGFFDSEGATLSGLQQVCYGTSCQPSSTTRYSLVVVPSAANATGERQGGSFAMCLPSASSGLFTAEHVLGLFVDFAQDDDLNTFRVDKSFVAPSIEGDFRFDPIPAIPTQASNVVPTPCDGQGGITALDATTVIHVRHGPQTVATLQGKDARISFTGQPALTPVAADFYILPFNGGSEADFTPASSSAARAGLELDRVQELIRKLDDAHASSTVERDQQPSGTGGTQAILAGLLNGALLSLPDAPAEGEQISLAGSRFVRFSTLTVVGGTSLAMTGRAHLDIDDGKVAGAKSLIGFFVFQLPWWSYILWFIAIGVFVVRLALKPDKRHPKWDAYKWVGWVTAVVAWLLVIFLWDLEMRAAFGASLLHGSFGQFRLIVGLLQFGLLAVAAFAAAGPLRIIGRNSFLLAHQGTFMGLSGGIAAILGFLFTAPYLRAFLAVLLEQVFDRLA